MVKSTSRARTLLPCLVFAFLIFAVPVLASPQRAIGVPTLKWQRAGCYSSWCETGWYSSPAVADLDGDGTPEVVAASYSTVILDGMTGTLKRRIAPPVSGARAWPGVVVADINADGALEIVTAHGSGYVRVLNSAGDEIWTRHPSSNELRSLAAFDLDGNGKLEIIVATAASTHTNQWTIYESDGTLRAGWPQLAPGQPGYAAGAYNENIGVADLDGDGRGEVIGPSDVHYITAYQDNGAQIPANSRYGSKFWSQVGVHVDDAVDLRGYAYCGTEHRPNFADSAPTLVDLNRDGVLEVVVVGNVYNCGTNPYTDLYHMPFIFKSDRSRWSGSGFDWTIIPSPDGQAAPLSEDYNVIETAMPNPVAADLDGDGYLEILYASYDGRIHTHWLDKTEHGNWPYSVYHAQDGFFRFASEPVVADLDNNGKAEVIFASWTQIGSQQTGKLHILDYLGNEVQMVNLPAAFGGDSWNGVLAAPTLADIDGDGELEVVLNSASSGVLAYDLPGTSQARILWGTGRGNYQRTGSLLSGSLDGSSKSVQAASISPGASSVLTYTITLRNPGSILSNVRVTDTLPLQIDYMDNLAVSSGNGSYASGVITWSGSVAAGPPVTIMFSGAIKPEVTAPTVISNTALIDDGFGRVLSRGATVIANGLHMFLPMMGKR